MTPKFTKQGGKDYEFWKSSNPVMVKKIRTLLDDIAAHPYTGIGHPEALKHELSGWWSRHITHEHRIIYRIKDDAIEVAQCRFHYSK